jgi:hypothetical protein
MISLDYDVSISKKMPMTAPVFTHTQIYMHIYIDIYIGNMGDRKTHQNGNNRLDENRLQ